jgi:hypothetical protein
MHCNYYIISKHSLQKFKNQQRFLVSVLNHGEGVCADPGKRDATLGVGGPGPPGKSDEQQLVPDSG